MVINGKRFGQAAVEYMIVVALGLLFLSPFLIMGYDHLNSFEETSKITTLINSLDKLSETIKAVHAQGYPSKIKISVLIPSNVVVAEIDENTDTIRYRISKNSGYEDIVRMFDFDVSGEVPKEQGRYVLVVKALEDGVNVSISS